MHGGNGWNSEKHGAKKPRKTWRKLHLAFDPDTGNKVDSKLTTKRVGDEAALPELIAEIDTTVSRFLADGTYDGQGESNCLSTRFGPDIEIIVPLPRNAVPGTDAQ